MSSRIHHYSLPFFMASFVFSFEWHFRLLWYGYDMSMDKSCPQIFFYVQEIAGCENLERQNIISKTKCFLFLVLIFGSFYYICIQLRFRQTDVFFFLTINLFLHILNNILYCLSIAPAFIVSCLWFPNYGDEVRLALYRFRWQVDFQQSALGIMAELELLWGQPVANQYIRGAWMAVRDEQSLSTHGGISLESFGAAVDFFSVVINFIETANIDDGSTGIQHVAQADWSPAHGSLGRICVFLGFLHRLDGKYFPIAWFQGAWDGRTTIWQNC